MSRIGEGKPLHQTAVLQQELGSLLQQFQMFGHGTDGYSVVQVGPGELVFTRKYWPTSYIVIAVVGFFLCLFGPLILLMNQQETFRVTMRPGPTPGTTEVTVSGLVDGEMMTRLMMILGQGTFQAVGAGRVTATGAPLSPDGHYWWDGTAWQPVAQSSPPPGGSPLPPPTV